LCPCGHENHSIVKTLSGIVLIVVLLALAAISMGSSGSSAGSDSSSGNSVASADVSPTADRDSYDPYKVGQGLAILIVSNDGINDAMSCNAGVTDLESADNTDYESQRSEIVRGCTESVAP
jgi:hypothetical protein